MYFVMSFRMVDILATFKNNMNNMLVYMIDGGINVYINNIMIYQKDKKGRRMFSNMSAPLI
jgi:hypothetical protein